MTSTPFNFTMWVLVWKSAIRATTPYLPTLEKFARAEFLSHGSSSTRLDIGFDLARPEGAFALEMLDLRLSRHVGDPLHLWAENGDGFVFPTTASDSPDNDPDPGTTIKSDMTTYSEEEEGGDYIDENGNGYMTVANRLSSRRLELMTTAV